MMPGNRLDVGGLTRLVTVSAQPQTCHAAPHCAVETIRAQVISLDGLLDYDEGDTEEATMELSLAAEALQEMLSRDYGDAILQALLAERCGRLLIPVCSCNNIRLAAQLLKHTATRFSDMLPNSIVVADHVS